MAFWLMKNETALYITISDHRRLVTFIIADASFLLQLYIFSVSLMLKMWMIVNEINEIHFFKIFVWSAFFVLFATIYRFSFNKKRILKVNRLVWAYKSMVNSITRIHWFYPGVGCQGLCSYWLLHFHCMKC